MLDDVGMTEFSIDGFTFLIGKGARSGVASAVAWAGGMGWCKTCCISIEEVNLAREANSFPSDLTCVNGSRSEV